MNEAKTIEYTLLKPSDGEYIIKVVELFRQQKITINKAHDFLNNDCVLVWVAHQADEICGYLMAYLLPRMDNGADMLHIYHVFVSENHQRKGIGEHLTSLALDYARANQLHYVYLITQSDNDPANGLYKKLGGYNHPANKEIYYWYLSCNKQ